MKTKDETKDDAADDLTQDVGQDADQNKDIDQTEKSTKSGLKPAIWGLVLGLIGMVVPLLALAGTILSGIATWRNSKQNAKGATALSITALVLSLFCLAVNSVMLFSLNNDSMAQMAQIAKVTTVTTTAATTTKATTTAAQTSTTQTTTPETQAPVVVESIEFGDVSTELAPGETEQVEAVISPDDADDPTLSWESSDNDVATVDEEGNVEAVGDGTATIKAVAASGVEASFDVSVTTPAPTSAVMAVRASQRRDDDVNIGSEWSYDFEIDGEPLQRQMELSVGQTLTCSATMTESDKKPDVGSGSETHTVTEDDLVNGFEVSFDVTVTEDGGRNRGQSAHFIVTDTFSPQ